MAERAIALRGLNQPFPTRLSNDYERRLAKLDTVAYDWLEPRLAAGLQNPQALEQMLLDFEDEMPELFSDAHVQTEADRVGQLYNKRHSSLFFRSLGTVAGLELIGDDTPGGNRKLDVAAGYDLGSVLAKIPGISRKRTKAVGLVKANLQPQLAVEAFSRDSVSHISTLRAGLVDGVRRSVGREVLIGREDPDILARNILQQWRRKGVPSLIPTRRLTKEGQPVMVRARAHAKLIARDQLAKVKSALDRTRQTTAGMTRFRWRTQRDRRVRALHRSFAGKIYSWAKGAGGGIWPGSQVGCRCYAQAFGSKAQVRASESILVIEPARAAA